MLAASALVAGCTLGPDWTAPRLYAPPHWSTAHADAAAKGQGVDSVPAGTALDAAWWRIFHDPVLEALETEAAPQNLSLRLAGMRFLEARAQRRMAGAAQYPLAGAEAGYAREAVSPKGVLNLFEGVPAPGTARQTATGAIVPAPLPAAASRGFDLWQYGFDASWELDFWGHVQREVESADAAVAAAEDERRDALVSVLAEVAGDYLALRGTQAALAVAVDAAVTARQALHLAAARSRPGAGEPAEAEAELHWQEAALPALQTRESALVNALSFLLGEAPGALRGRLGDAAAPVVPPVVPIGVPSTLARRRPDIRAAEARLHEATAEIGVAIADFYPRFTLDGSVGVSAMQFKDLGNFSARQYGFGPSVSLPVFSGGRLRAVLSLRKQQQQEAAILYQETVLRAWREVDDALTAYAGEQRRAAALAAAARSAQTALQAALRRYAHGGTNFLVVLDAERMAVAARLAAADSGISVAEDLVQLYKALGGGWEDVIPEAPAER